MNSQALIRNTHILCTHHPFPLIVTSCRAIVQYYILYLDINAVKIQNSSITPRDPHVALLKSHLSSTSSPPYFLGTAKCPLPMYYRNMLYNFFNFIILRILHK